MLPPTTLSAANYNERRASLSIEKKRNFTTFITIVSARSIFVTCRLHFYIISFSRWFLSITLKYNVFKF